MPKKPRQKPQAPSPTSNALPAPEPTLVAVNVGLELCGTDELVRELTRRCCGLLLVGQTVNSNNTLITFHQRKGDAAVMSGLKAHSDWLATHDIIRKSKADKAYYFPKTFDPREGDEPLAGIYLH